MSPVDPTGRPPYLQIADEIRLRIRRGQYPPGQALPGERELAGEFGVTRPTLHAGIEVLAREGVVVSRHGRGNFVRSVPRVPLPVTRFSRTERTADLGSWQKMCADAGQVGKAADGTVATVPAPAHVAALLEVAGADRVIARGWDFRLEDVEHPVGTYRTWYPAQLFAGTKIAEPPPLREGGLNAMDALGHRAVSAREQVTARVPTMAEAALFGLAAGSAAVLEITRVAREEGGRPIEVLQVVFSADLVTLAYDLPL